MKIRPVAVELFLTDRHAAANSRLSQLCASPQTQKLTNANIAIVLKGKLRKVNFTLGQAMRPRSGSRVMALLFL